MKRTARLHTLPQSESGFAIMSVVGMAAALMILFLLAPTVFRGVTKQGLFNQSKVELQNEAFEVKALLKYRPNCKRIITALGLTSSMATQKSITFDSKTVEGAIQNQGSLQAGTQLSKWQAPGPWVLELGNKLFPDRNAYLASLWLQQETEVSPLTQKLEAVLTPKPEEIRLYIGFATDGTVAFCESTSVSAKTQQTFEDQVCNLNTGGTGTNRYDPTTMICRTPVPTT